MIEVPKDEIIYKESRNTGKWEKDVRNFLSSCIRELKKENTDISLIDLGANIGLTSLQVVKNINFSTQVIAVEPLPQQIAALERNLKSFSKTIEVVICQDALGLEFKMEYTHKQNTNLVDTSLIVRVVPPDQLSKVRIQMLNTEEFSTKYLGIDNKFIIKSDFQGFDAKVLARLGKRICGKTYAASVGVRALNEIERQDVTNLMGNWKHINRTSWSSFFTNIVAVEEVQELWLSGTNTHRNIYLKK